MSLRVLKNLRWLLAVVVLGVVVGACDDDALVVGPRPTDAEIEAVLDAMVSVSPGQGFSWFDCAPATAFSAVETIDGGGGTITLASGTSIVVPEGAVSGPTRFSLLEPVSPFVVAFADVEGDVSFDVPVQLTLDFSERTACVGGATFAVFRADPDGDHVRITGAEAGETSVTVQLDSFSGYAIASN